MILFIMIWSIFLTGGDLFTSHLKIEAPRKLSDIKMLEQAKAADSSKKINPKTLPPTNTVAPGVSQQRSSNPQEINNALQLTQAVYSHLKKKTGSLPERVAASYLNRINQIRKAIADYDKAYDIYVLNSNTEKGLNEFDFIHNINDTFQQNYLFKTLPSEIFADFISKIFATMVEPYIYAHFWSQTPELFLQQDLQRIIKQKPFIGMLLYQFLESTIEKLKFIKTAILDDTDNDITLAHFKNSLNSEITLSINDWIVLAKKLAENIHTTLAEVKKNEEKKQTANTETTKAVTDEQKRTKVTIKLPDTEEIVRPSDQDGEKNAKSLSFKDLSEEQLQEMVLEKHAKRASEIMKEEDQDFTRIFNEMKEVEISASLDNLKKDIQQRFDTLKKREQELTMPQKLTKINKILNVMHVLLTTKKSDPESENNFLFLLNEVYSELMDQRNLEQKISEYGRYLLNDTFNAKDLYKPLYDIIIYKLNTLLSLYAANNNDLNRDKILTIEATLKTPKNEEYSFSVSIKNLQKYNDEAEFFPNGELKSLAHPTTWGDTFSTIKNIGGKAAARLSSVIAAQITLPMRLWNWMFSESEEQKKEREDKEAKQKAKQTARDAKLDAILEAILPTTKVLGTPPTNITNKSAATTTVSTSTTGQAQSIANQPDKTTKQQEKPQEQQLEPKQPTTTTAAQQTTKATQTTPAMEPENKLKKNEPSKTTNALATTMTPTVAQQDLTNSSTNTNQGSEPVIFRQSANSQPIVVTAQKSKSEDVAAEQIARDETSKAKLIRQPANTPAIKVTTPKPTDLAPKPASDTTTTSTTNVVTPNKKPVINDSRFNL